MKHHRYIVILLFILAAIPLVTYAATFSTTKGLGARVVQTVIVNKKPNKALVTTVYCAGRDYMLLAPIGSNSAPAIYFVPFQAKGPKAIADVFYNKYFLGIVKTEVDMKTCKNPSSGAPIPAYEIVNYSFSGLKI